MTMPTKPKLNIEKSALVRADDIVGASLPSLSDFGLSILDSADGWLVGLSAILGSVGAAEYGATLTTRQTAEVGDLCDDVTLATGSINTIRRSVAGGLIFLAVAERKEAARSLLSNSNNLKLHCSWIGHYFRGETWNDLISSFLHRCLRWLFQPKVLIPASRRGSLAPTKVTSIAPLSFRLFRLRVWILITIVKLACITANGNIFTITAKSQAVSITSFDINMDGATTPQPAPVEIYFLPTTDPGFASNSFPYTKIFMDNVTGKGKGNTTVLPDLTTPVVIPAGSTYSFYITVASFSFGTNIWYNTGVAVGDVVASDQHISIGEGYALGYPFLGYTPKRRWNGEIWISNVVADITYDTEMNNTNHICSTFFDRRQCSLLCSFTDGIPNW
jgi:hypothetical protein